MRYLVKKKNNNGLYYLYLIEMSYDPEKKKNRQKIIQSFGNVTEFEKNHPDEYAELVQKYGDKRTRNKIEKEQIVNRFFEDSNKSSSNLELLSNVKNLMPQRIAHLALRKLWQDDLMMPKFFDYLVRHETIEAEYNISEIAQYFSMLKIVCPSSYLNGMEISPRFLGDPMSEYTTDDVYRCLSVLAKHKDSIMRHINKRIDVLVPREKSLLFFDCTNCYFETAYNDTYWYRRKALRQLRRELKKTDERFKSLNRKECNQIIEENPIYLQRLNEIIDSFGDPLRMHGPSKEKRFDLPLVSVALVVDDHAIPIDFKVFSGNQAETSTMIEVIKELKIKYRINNAILVADSALNGTKNLCRLLKENMGFSVAKSALSFSEQIREHELNLNTFSPIKDEAGNDTPLLYKIIDYHNTRYDRTELDKNDKSTKYVIDCKLMITFSEERYKRDITVLEDNIRRAQRAVETKEQIKASATGWKSFVNIGRADEIQQDSSLSKAQDTSAQSDVKKKKSDITIALSLNEEMIKKRRQCAGYAGILFKEPPDSKEQLTPSYVSSLYHHLVQIEECFRIMKHDFEIRPVYVRERDSINGHILLCVIALIMIRIIQRKFKEDGLTITAKQIQECLESLKLMLLTTDGHNCIYLNSLEADRRNCLRNAKDKALCEEDMIKEKLLDMLDCRINENVNTLAQLRSSFHVKKLSQSEYQQELLRKYCCSNKSDMQN